MFDFSSGNSKKKILFYVPSIVYGGGESYVYNLVCKLIEFYNVEILILTACESLENNLKDVNVKVKLISASPSLGFGLFKGLISLNYYSRTLKPDIVFLNGLAEAGAFSRFIYKGNSSFISIGHSNEFWLRQNHILSIKILVRKVITFNFFKYLDKLIVITDEALKSVETKEVFNCKVVKIHNGSPIIKLSDVNLIRVVPTFGRISRLCEGKGNVQLINAFAKLIRNGYNAKLIFAGTGPQLSHLESLVKYYKLTNFIVFVGHVAPNEFFSSIDCMVSTSVMEGLPTVISESFSCHVPVISTCVGGVPEMITHDYNGFLIKPDSELEIYNALNHFINNPELYKYYAVNAYNTYLNYFSIDVSTYKTWDFFND